MRKVTSKKKPSGIRKIFMGPSAAIVAATVGGMFSLTNVLLPRVLPIKGTDASAATPAPQAIAQVPAPIPIPIEHEVLPPVAYAPAIVPSVPQVVVTPTVIIAPAPTPTEFKAEQITSSLSQAEAKSPARNEVRNDASPRHRPNLTYGVWTIFASKDARGTLWNNSTLKITAQKETPQGLQVSGFLDWRANGRCAGREFVVGNYDDLTRNLFIEGQRSAGCDRKLALSACSAKLSEDGRRLVDGTWGSASAHRPTVPGRWEARR